MQDQSPSSDFTYEALDDNNVSIEEMLQDLLDYTVALEFKSVDRGDLHGESLRGGVSPGKRLPAGETPEEPVPSPLTASSPIPTPTPTSVSAPPTAVP